MTSHLFYMNDSEGQKMKMTPISKNPKFAAMPGLKWLNYKMDEDKLLKYMSKNNLSQSDLEESIKPLNFIMHISNELGEDI